MLRLELFYGEILFIPYVILSFIFTVQNTLEIKFGRILSNKTNLMEDYHFIAVGY